ncbi:unnamed protein product, partial [Prorocentrum cordatum]
ELIDRAIGWTDRPFDEKHWEDQDLAQSVQLVRDMLAALERVPKMSDRMKTVTLEGYNDTVPEFLAVTRKEISDGLGAFWDEHPIAQSADSFLAKIESMEAFTEIKAKLAKRLTERIQMLVRLTNGAIFGNFPRDAFWAERWIDTICTPDDITDQAFLICGTGYEAGFTQDAVKAFEDASEAARYADTMFQWQVGAITNIARVWLVGVPFLKCKMDFDEAAAKAWRGGQDALNKL